MGLFLFFFTYGAHSDCETDGNSREMQCNCAHLGNLSMNMPQEDLNHKNYANICGCKKNALTIKYIYF